MEPLGAVRAGLADQRPRFVGCGGFQSIRQPGERLGKSVAHLRQREFVGGRQHLAHELFPVFDDASQLRRSAAAKS